VSNIDRSSTRDKDPLTPFYTVAMDIWGPMPIADIGGNMMFLGGVSYNTSTIIGNVMKHKTDAASTWKSMVSSVKSLGQMICLVRIDNGTNLLSK
jgi:hypothetical protein